MSRKVRVCLADRGKRVVQITQELVGSLLGGAHDEKECMAGSGLSHFAACISHVYHCWPRPTLPGHSACLCCKM